MRTPRSAPRGAPPTGQGVMRGAWTRDSDCSRTRGAHKIALIRIVRESTLGALPWNREALSNEPHPLRRLRPHRAPPRGAPEPPVRGAPDADGGAGRGRVLLLPPRRAPYAGRPQ